MSPTPLQSLSRYAKVSVVGVIRSPPRQTLPPRNELTFDRWCCLADRCLDTSVTVHCLDKGPLSQKPAVAVLCNALHIKVAMTSAYQATTRKRTALQVSALTLIYLLLSYTDLSRIFLICLTTRYQHISAEIHAANLTLLHAPMPYH